MKNNDTLARAQQTLKLSSLAVLISCAQEAQARPGRVDHVPAGQVQQCRTCHFNAGGGAVNAFGYDVQLTLVGGVAQWDQVCQLDSDLDGYSNGEELGDASCVWEIGAGPAPDEGAIISNPGDPDSVPVAPPDMMIDMMVPDMILDMEPLIDQALPDMEVWDAWLERPPLEDGFSVMPLDASPLERDASLSPDEGPLDLGEQDLGELDLGVAPDLDPIDIDVQGGEDQGQEAGTNGTDSTGGAGVAGEAAPEAGGDDLKGERQEASLPDELAGCQTQADPGAPLAAALIALIALFGRAPLLRRAALRG